VRNRRTCDDRRRHRQRHVKIAGLHPAYPGILWASPERCRQRCSGLSSIGVICRLPSSGADPDNRLIFRAISAPYVFRTADLWENLDSARHSPGHQSVRGYAHVIKEDLVQPNLLFLGTEFGPLRLNRRRERRGQQFKGSRFPAVAVRDLAIATARE